MCFWPFHQEFRYCDGGDVFVSSLLSSLSVFVAISCCFVAVVLSDSLNLSVVNPQALLFLLTVALDIRAVCF